MNPLCIYCDKPLSSEEIETGNVCANCAAKTCTICGEWLNDDKICEYCLEDNEE